MVMEMVGCAGTQQLAPGAIVASSSSSSSSSPCVVGMGVRCLPVARGLRIGASRTKFSFPGVASHSAARSQKRGIVCEAQETVIGGIRIPFSLF